MVILFWSLTWIFILFLLLSQKMGKYHQLRAKRMLALFCDVLLRTRRALSLYWVYGNSTLLVLNGTFISPVESQKGIISCWEPEGHYRCTEYGNSTLLVLNETFIYIISWKPEGHYITIQSMAIAPFWFLLVLNGTFIHIVSWEPEGHYLYLVTFWEPEGCYHWTESMANSTLLVLNGTFISYLQLRARKALSLFNDVPLRTRRALLLYRVYGDSALLVLNGTLLNSINVPFIRLSTNEK